MLVSTSFDKPKMWQYKATGNEAYTWFTAYKYANLPVCKHVIIAAYKPCFIAQAAKPLSF